MSSTSRALWCTSRNEQHVVAKAWHGISTTSSSVDSLVRIGIPLFLLRKYGFCHGTWLIVEYPMSSRRRLAQVVAIDVESHHVFLSPALFFNLGISPHSWGKIKIRRASSVQISGKKSSILPHTKQQVMLALTATIARVRQVDVSIDDDETEQLCEFFKTPRVFAIGDVFRVPRRTKPNSSTESVLELPSQMVRGGNRRARALSRLELRDCSSLCYKVIDLKPQGDSNATIAMTILAGETTLVQSNSVSSTMPHAVQYFEEDVQEDDPSCTVCSSFCEYSHVYSEKISPLHDVNAFHKLMELLLPVWNCTLRPEQANLVANIPFTVLLEGSRGSGQVELLDNAAQCLGFNIIHTTFAELSATPSEQQIAASIVDLFEQAVYFSPCIVHIEGTFGFTIQDDDSMSELAFATALTTALCDANRKTDVPIVLVCSVASAEEIPVGIRDCFLHDLHLDSPDETTRLSILNRLLSDSTRLDDQIDLSNLSSQLAGRNLGEIKALIADTGAKAMKKFCSVDQFWITTLDFQQAIAEQQTPASVSLGSPSIPNVKWDDVGGLEHVKGEILDVVELPLKCPELFASGVRQRSGILLYGPPGTGKTLLAKAIATECSLNFISVKGPELLNMYIGESEKNVRQVFETARNARPCILFFDELDSLAPMRGRGSDSGGVMDRVVSQLLTELDGVQEGTDVFVIGATNRPDLLESALLRPGRFDRLLYLGIATDREAQMKVMSALTRKFTLSSDVNLNAVLEKCPLTFTGADFYALCSTALANSIQDKVMQFEAHIEQVNMEDCYSSSPLTAAALLQSLSDEDLKAPVCQRHFIQALSSIVPSVSAAELSHYERLRDQFASN